MITHAHYEELCALAVSGQASSTELAEIRSHLESCPSCRGTVHDFISVSAHGLAKIAADRSDSRVPFGMTARFLARARSEGIEFSRIAVDGAVRSSARLRRGLAVASFAVAAVVLFAALAAFKARLSWFAFPKSSTPASVATTRPIQDQSLDRALDSLRGQLTSTEVQIQSMSDVIQKQRADLESATRNIASLESELSTTQQQSSALQEENAERDNKVSELEGELNKARLDKNASEIALTVQENELRELRKKVSEQGDTLAQQQALSAKGSGILDLVTARNLHIIDVHDRDGSGTSQRTYGRIFYTEGKSLIFYAYDLTDPHKLDAKVSFYVWGQRLGSEKPIKNLGVLHSDDESDGRWVLTFDDPSTLAQIDSVFVTAESSKKPAKEPRGQKILFAFLGGSPNHP